MDRTLFVRGGLLALLLALPAAAQPGAIERLLLLKAGTRSLSDRDLFQYWAIQNAQNNQRNQQQQQAIRQQGAAAQAERERQRIQGALGSGRRPGAGGALPTNPPAEPPPPNIDPAILVLWNTFGVVLAPAAPEQLATTKFAAGLQIIATRSGGPAEQAGWIDGDVVVGLHKYQTQELANVLYVAQLSELPKLEQVPAIIVRSQQTYRTAIRPNLAP